MKFRGITLFAVLGASVASTAFVSFAGAQDASPATRSEQTEASLAPGTAILAELTSGIDSKKVKVGDAIAAHTTETLKSTDDRTVLPKGTKLEGHVTQAAARGKGGNESALGIQFDKAKLKDGGEISLNVVIQALAGPVSFSAPSDLGKPPNLGTTQTSPMSGTRSAPPPQQQAPTTASVPDSSGGPSSPVLDTRSRGVIGLRGMTLNPEPANNRAATVVVSNGKSVHLDGGTQILLVEQQRKTESSGQ
jgi:hypothetical protein